MYMCIYVYVCVYKYISISIHVHTDLGLLQPDPVDNNDNSYYY